MTSVFPLLYDARKGEPISFRLTTDYTPKGDQPEAIASLIRGVENNEENQVLLGVTGSGKTFTIAHVLAHFNRPTLIMAPNKTLAAQLYTEMKEFFPQNAVEYFVSYYDYYQPEAYVPKTNTYIEKTASINEQIDRMRHSATRSLLERRDVIIVASVSCIYGIGGVSTYSEMIFKLEVDQTVSIQEVSRRLVELQYKRNDMILSRGMFRIKGDIMDIFPAHSEDRAWRLSFFDDVIESITEIDALSNERFEKLSHIVIFANSHYVTPGPTIQQAIKNIRIDLKNRLEEFKEENKLVELQRLEQKTNFDLEMMAATGTCAGIENYSRYLTGRKPGEAPPTLFEYLPKDALLIVDESHVSVPQIGGMFRGDQARKSVLSDHGFRLPSCRDNRPLKFEEWEALRPLTIYVSATPGVYELEKTGGSFIEQIIRPTGLVDPTYTIVPCKDQIDYLMQACRSVISEGFRALVTTLTKKMAEALAEYFGEANFKVRYLHSDIETLERIEIIRDLRLGVFDILIGINLLREGLDIPECALVAILDADKEGFLRSKTSLIQTIGRAARNEKGHVILFADTMTKSMQGALSEADRRRQKQIEYNEKFGITPTSVKRKISDLMFNEKKEVAQKISKKKKEGDKQRFSLSDLSNLKKFNKIKDSIRKEMQEAASNLDFEKAAVLRDQIKTLDQMWIDLGGE